MRKSKSLDRDYFEGLYRQDDDPWKFATSPYEQAKYQHTLSALGEERAASALEVGCSIGVLTEKLASHCETLTSTDISQSALDRAKARCADLTNVDFRLVSSAGDSFDGRFDLIVLSEVIYYWDDADLALVAEKLTGTILPGGRLLMVHWLGETNYPKSADDAIEHLATQLTGRYVVEQADRTQDYRLDLWRWTAAV
jgi:2-polyprenyl-3-methyl-5-hydroxy-6-metoxy-1,4-benzoquinol methylase